MAADKKPKPAVDWEAVEKEYRAGVLSVSEIGRRNGVTEGAIRKRAKRDGWERDLTAKVQEKVRTGLVRTEVRGESDGAKSRTERQIVDDAAAAVIALVREHRADLRAGRELATTLLKQLQDVTGNREAIEAAIAEHIEAGPQRAAMIRAVSLPSNVACLRELSNVLKNLIPLERQAFNVDDGGPPDEPDNPEAGKASTDEALAAFATKLAAITGVPVVQAAPQSGA